ncbi:MAG: cytochrome c biogenesis protein CcsA [Fermentimonas sp.]|jgi:cytochrome c-type biogenesis protein CcsB
MERFVKFLSSYRATILLLTVYAVGLALATFVEKWFGPMASRQLIYYSPIFILLQLLLVVNFIIILLEHEFAERGRWALVVVHGALVVIMAGALTTHLFGREGVVHIREGEIVKSMSVSTNRGNDVESLPFELELVNFSMHRYPGSESPSSYESELLVHVDGEVREAKVYMNNVLDVKGYRFFQASYDEDEKGTILSVNKDVAGRTITYAGYVLLLAGMVMSFAMPRTRFRKLIARLNDVRGEIGKLTMVGAFIMTSLAAFGGDSYLNIPEYHAEAFGGLAVQSRGRVMPVNTLSGELVRKLHKGKTVVISGLGNEETVEISSDDFLLSLLCYGEKWKEVKFLASPNANVASMYGLSYPYFAYKELFDEHGHYKLLKRMEEIYHKAPAERNSTDKSLMKVDEQINIMFMLMRGDYVNMFPDKDDPTHRWLADNEDSLFSKYLSVVRDVVGGVTGYNIATDMQKADALLEEIRAYQFENDNGGLIDANKIKAELLYNKANLFSISRLLYLILGGVLLVVSFLRLIKNETDKDVLSKVLRAGIIVVFVVHGMGIGLRWYISGYAPWSNSYETMVYVAWATLLAGIIFGRKSSLTMSLGSLFGGVILFVSGLSWMDPEIGPLVPVLKSPWLMFHVAVIVFAYGFFGISFLLGVVNMSLMSVGKQDELSRLRIKELSLINSMSLMVGLALMTIGTFLGAVWANESWGRYWGWDPKETWALITIVVYTIVTHVHLMKKRRVDWLLNLLSSLAFSTVLMTFLGVNYLLSGMHSYGQTEGVSAVFWYIVAGFAVVGILGVTSYRSTVKER